MSWRERPVEAAREILDSEFSIRWPAPLIRWLRERSPDLALDWVFRITPYLLAHCGTPYLEELIEKLDELRRWRECPPEFTQFKELHDEWEYRRRDHAETALCHLCHWLGVAVCPGQEIDSGWLYPVPSLLSRPAFGDPVTELAEWCLADFEAFVAGR